MEGTFRDCSSLTAVTIPSSVTSIYDNAFFSCWSLTSVTTKNKSPISIKNETFPNRWNSTLYVPRGSKKNYQKNGNFWSQFKSIVEFDLPTHSLTYVVDGVEYKKYTIEEDASISPEPEPTKEGYTFSGWIGLPEIMPDHDVVVEGIFTPNTNINEIITSDNGGVTIYSLNGIQIKHPQKGLNIIRYRNGKSKIVLVK